MTKQRALQGAGIVVALVTSGLLSASPAMADAVPIGGTGVVRLAGNDRYETAVAISLRVFTTPQEVVFVASGEDFPDALAAGPAAAHFRAPILLVRRSGIPNVVLDEIQRLAPRRVYVVGGPGAIQDSVVTLIEAALSGATITRVSGRDRYATAEAVSHLFTGFGRYVLASGEDYPDGLAGGAEAAAMDGPLLLTRRDSLPIATRRVLAAEQSNESPDVVVVGGTGVISSDVTDQIRALLPAVEMWRLGGRDRYETSALVAKDIFDLHQPSSVFLASGSSFADALAGTPVAGIADRAPEIGIHGSPVVLTRSTCHPTPTWKLLQERSYPLRVVLGGTAVAYAGTSQC